MVTLVLFASVFPFRFPLLNFSMRDGHDFFCERGEPFKWRFVRPCFFVFHSRNIWQRARLSKLGFVPFVLLCPFDKLFRRWRSRDFSIICNAKETVKSGRKIFSNDSSLAARDGVTAAFFE